MPERENNPLTVDELQQLAAAITPRIPKDQHIKIIVEKDVVKLSDLDDVLITRIKRNTRFILNEE
jgi:hypothetical protein